MWQEFEMEAWFSEFSCCELFPQISLIFPLRIVLTSFLLKQLSLCVDLSRHKVLKPT